LSSSVAKFPTEYTTHLLCFKKQNMPQNNLWRFFRSWNDRGRRG